jgi:hypothetical protein
VKTWRVILATIVIYGAGVITGGLLIGHLGSPAPQATQHPPPGPARPGQRISAGVMRIEFLRRIEKDLNLSAQQKQRVDAILSDGQERTRLIMEPFAPQIRQELNKTLDDFRAALTPPQQTRFDELLKQAQRSREPHRGPGGEKREHSTEGSLPDSQIEKP